MSRGPTTNTNGAGESAIFMSNTEVGLTGLVLFLYLHPYPWYHCGILQVTFCASLAIAALNALPFTE